MASFFQSDATTNAQNLQDFDIQVTKLLKTKFEAEKKVQIAEEEKERLNIQISEVSLNVNKLSENDAERQKEIQEMKLKMEKAAKECEEFKKIGEKVLKEYSNAKELQEKAQTENGILRSQIEKYSKICENFITEINKSDSETSTQKSQNMVTNCAVQVIEHVSEGRFRLKQEVIDKIYNTNRVKNYPLVLLCIAGAARKGKSFLLNFFLDYLKHYENNPDKPWKMEEDTDLNGFKFQSGEDRTTLGIWAWNRVFVIKQKDGTEIAISLIDSQGVFDNKTSFADCSTIFASTCLFSSIMCFNVFHDLQEDTINNLAAFIEHGKKVNGNLGGSGKLFQELVFIIRDFQYANYLKEENGGEKYIEKKLGPNDLEELQKVRNTLNESYEQRKCFVFPRPGDKVMDETASQVSDIDEKFVQKVETMVNKLFSNLGNKVKKIGSTVVKCGDMSEYMGNVVQTFADNKQFAPQAVQIVNRNYMISLEEKRAIEDYEKQMNGVFQKYINGCDETLLKTLNEACCAKIEADFVKRIHDADILKTLMTKFNESCQKLLTKYIEKNETLLKQEAERIRHEKELKDEAEKREKEKREAEKQIEKIKKEEEEKREKMKEEEKVKIEKMKAEEKETIENMKKEEQKRIQKLMEESEAKEKVRDKEEQARLQKIIKEGEERIEKMKKEGEERIRKIIEDAEAKEKQRKEEEAIREAKRVEEEKARIQAIKDQAKADIEKAKKKEEEKNERKKEKERKEKESARLAEVEAEMIRMKEEEKKRAAKQEEQRKLEAAAQQKREAEETVKNEFERFKSDMAKKLRNEFATLNPHISYRTTINGWHCCIFYNQGVTYTDVKVFYRKSGNTIYELCESYLFAYKANRLEGLLQESLKHADDVRDTFKNAVQQAG